MLASCGSSGGHALRGSVDANLDVDYLVSLTENGFHGTCRLTGVECWARLTGKPCPKDAKFDAPLVPGAAVTVSDRNRHVLAVTHLQVGDVVGFDTCRLTFATKVAANSDWYWVTIANMPDTESEFSRAQLERAHWNVKLKS
jgi:hypothetical protein